MTRILLLGGVAGSLLLGGCATAPLTEARADTFALCDADFVAKIERVARRQGSAIRWYRCPQFVPTGPPPSFHHGERRDA